MKKITQNLRWLVTLLAMMVCTGAWAEETTIATATFDGKNATYTTGWTTTGTGKGRTDCVIIGAGENITSPAFNLSGYSSVTITFTGRRYGSLTGSKATVNASIGGVSVGTINITNGSVGAVSGGITFTPTPSMTAASLVFTCTNATSAGSTHGAGIGSITIKGTTSGGTVVTKTLTSIAISGTYPTTFQQGDAFSHEGMTVTATYDDESTADVTSSATFSGYDMSSVSEQTVTVTYKEEEVTKTASYTITVKEKAPVVDYATLPFEYNGGRNAINTDIVGLSQEGLGTDYNVDDTKLKFDGTGDWVLLKIDEVPGKLSFVIKGNSFSGGTFSVQTSKDGETYTNLKSYTELGDTQTETFYNLSSDVRYIKWIYTNKSSGNVGLGNIKLTKYLPYTLTINDCDNADIYVFYNDDQTNSIANSEDMLSNNNVLSNSEIYISASAKEGYVLESVTVTDGNGDKISLNKVEGQEGIAWTFTMPESNVTVSCTVKEDVPAKEYTFKKVTSTADLVAGAEYIIVCESQKKVMTSYGVNGSKVFNQNDVSINNSTITILEGDANILTLGGATDAWTLQTSLEGKYVSLVSSSNALNCQENVDDYIYWTITFNGGNCVISSNEFNTRTIRYNSGSPRFAAYTSGQQDIQLYKKETSPTVTIGDSKWATYVAEDNVTFPSGVSAYTVETIETDHVTLGEALAVKKGTPILVYSETPGTYPLEVVAEEDCDETFNNQLKVSDGTVKGGATIYALANKDNVVGFYPVASNVTIPDGKAYLNTSSAKNLVKGFLALGGLADAINNIAVETANGTIFNIAGQKVQNITKGGLYIVNGKKVIIK